MHVEEPSLVAGRYSQNHVHQIGHFPHILGYHQTHNIVNNITSKGVAGDILKVPQGADVAIMLSHWNPKKLDKIICGRHDCQVVSQRRWAGNRDFC
jgi:hypothetical protein